MKDCVFCQVACGQLPGTFFYQDKQFMVIKDIHPQAAVHWMVIPKKHVTDFAQAPEGLIAQMTKLTKEVIRKEKLTSYRVVSNGGEAALIEHFHIHVLGSVDKYRNL